MHFLAAAHTAPEFIAHVAASCGAALFGVIGAKATRAPRALMTAKVAARRRKAAEEVLVRRARRAELSESVTTLGHLADWNDLAVDEPDNRLISFPKPVNSISAAGPSNTPFALFDEKLKDTSSSRPSLAPLKRHQNQRRTPNALEFLHDDEIIGDGKR